MATGVLHVEIMLFSAKVLTVGRDAVLVPRARPFQDVRLATSGEQHFPASAVDEHYGTASELLEVQKMG